MLKQKPISSNRQSRSAGRGRKAKINRARGAPMPRFQPNGKGSPMTSVPAAMSRIMRTPVPMFTSDGKGGDGRIRVRHREYIADISGSANFSDRAFFINPGLSQTFPWLSGISTRYESYLFHMLRFEFETSVSTATQGTVILAIDYDAADAPAISKQQLLENRGAVRSAAWAPCQCVADFQDLTKFGVQRYLRHGALLANMDIKTYDVGRLEIGTQGMTGTAVVGELYAEYDVELMTPQIDQEIYDFSIASGGGGIALSTPFGDAPVRNGNGDVLALPGSLVFTRVGSYIIIHTATGTGFLPLTGPDTTASTAQVVYLANTRISSGAATSAEVCWQVTCTAIGQTLAIDWDPYALSVTSSFTWEYRVA